MKKNKYQHFEEICPDIFLHYNALSNNFLLLSKGKHSIYENSTAQELEKNDEKLFQLLVLNKFLVEDNMDETLLTLQAKEQMIQDKELYNVFINTTLDCNLNCWYCYENRIENSKLSTETIDIIKKNINRHYQSCPYKTLKVSFFGGEPFMDFNGIQTILNFAKEFCEQKEIELIADFTTNATLITKEIIDYLKQFRCHFQITLDGGRDTHNRIKKCRFGKMDTYQKVIDTLRWIDTEISKRWIAVRINFDNHTLRCIDEIIHDISFLDRTKCYVIVKKVWQLETGKVDREALMSAIQKLFDNRFLVDYYLMPKGCVCFAERKNETLFNYDGKIFKCTTISTFDDKNKLGNADTKTGEIHWDTKKMEDWYRDMQPDYCKSCHWFPVCLGICNRQIMAHPNEKICTFDACSLTQKEYLMYLFKYNQLKYEIYENQ